MSAEAVIYALLAGAGPVTAIVGDRIYPEFLPLDKALPALVYDQISRVERNAVSLAQPTVKVVSRIQVTALVPEKAYPQKKALLAAVRAACANRLGTIAGVADVTTDAGTWGPDLRDAELAISSQSIDFMVTFNQAAA